MEDEHVLTIGDLIPLLDGQEPTPKPTTKIDLTGTWVYSTEAGTFVQVPDPPAPKPDPDAALAWDQMVPEIEAGKPGPVPPDDWAALVPPCGAATPKAGGPVPGGPQPSVREGKAEPAATDAGDQCVQDTGDGLCVPAVTADQGQQQGDAGQGAV